MIDYEKDPRPLSECLKEFAVAINGGKTYGARQKAADELRTPKNTLNTWMDGRGCGSEPLVRWAMTRILQSKT